MRILILLIVFVSLLSCQRQLYKSHQECTLYFDYVKKHWVKKGNDFFLIDEPKDTSALSWIEYGNTPRFMRQWNKYYDDCICTLTAKEAKLLFGKPTRITETFKFRSKVTTETYGYLISDGKCEEIISEKNQPNRCSYLAFTFWKGRQDKGYITRPSLKLRDVNFYPRW